MLHHQPLEVNLPRTGFEKLRKKQVGISPAMRDGPSFGRLSPRWESRARGPPSRLRPGPSPMRRQAPGCGTVRGYRATRNVSMEQRPLPPHRLAIAVPEEAPVAPSLAG